MKNGAPADPDASPVASAIRERFKEDIVSSHGFRGDETVRIRADALLKVARALRDDYRFEFLIDICGVDYLDYLIRDERFEVVYHFRSYSGKARMRLKVGVDESRPEIDSLTSLWKGAGWLEREVFDMFGIRFRGHPDLRRILMYEEFEGHPLRKDYPLTKRQPLVKERTEGGKEWKERERDD